MEPSEEWLVNTDPGSIFTSHSLERSSSYSPDFFLFLEALECNGTSDWLYYTV